MGSPQAEEESINQAEAGEEGPLLDGDVEEGDIQVRASATMYVAILLGACGAMVFGFSLGFSSPTLVDTAKCSEFADADWGTNRAKLNCDLGLTHAATFWFGSTVNLGAAAGALAAGRVVDRFGLKRGMCAGYALCAVGYTLLLLVPRPGYDAGVAASPADAEDCSAAGCAREPLRAPLVALLVASRVVVGAGVGVITCTCPPYLNEVATIEVRGAAGASFQVGCVSGLLFAYLLGAVMGWWPLALVAALLAAACAGVTALLLPQSPRWLAARRRRAPALAALCRLRAPAPGAAAAFDDQLAALYGVFVRETGGGAGGGGDDAPPRLADAFRGTAGKALLIGVSLSLTQQLSGINMVNFYSGMILGDVFPGSARTSNLWALGIQVIQVTVTVATAPLLDRSGRRALLIFSLSGMVGACGLIASFYLHDDPDDYTMRCVAVAGLYSYMMFFSCGLGAIPWAMMGELFPIRVKGTQASIATLANWLGAFVITLTPDMLADAFGPSHEADGHHKGRGWVFVLYGAFCLAGLAVVSAVVPETKGRSIEQVQRDLAAPVCACGRAARGDGAAAAR